MWESKQLVAPSWQAACGTTDAALTLAISGTGSITPWGKPGEEATTSTVLRVMAFFTAAGDSLCDLSGFSCRAAALLQCQQTCCMVDQLDAPCMRTQPSAIMYDIKAGQPCST